MNQDHSLLMFDEFASDPSRLSMIGGTYADGPDAIYGHAMRSSEFCAHSRPHFMPDGPSYDLNSVQGVPSVPRSDSLSPVSERGTVTNDQEDGKRAYECDVDDMKDKHVDKKTRHKLVEQNRREKTRALTAELQDLVVPGSTVAAGTSINTVLEGVLQYLRNVAGKEGIELTKEEQANRSSYASCCLQYHMSADAVPRQLLGGQWSGAFESAPMGVIMAQLSGEVVRCNSIFFNLFGLDKMVGTPTMFSLTAPSYVPATIKAASAVISGQAKSVTLIKRCLRRGEREDEFQVEMRCLKVDNKPQYMICYVRHTNSRGLKCLSEAELSTDLYTTNHERFVTSSVGGLSIPTIEEIEEAEMDNIFAERSDYFQSSFESF